MSKRWQIRKLGELCQNLDSLRKPITKKNRRHGDIPYYGATGIVDYVADYIFNEKLVLLGEDGAKWSSGDECAFMISGKTWVNNHAHVLRPNRTVILDKWLIYYLNFQDLTPFISGMTVPKLTQGKMNEIPVPVPPITEQQLTIDILDEVLNLIGKAKININKSLINLKNLFESRLESFFHTISTGHKELALEDIIESNVIGLTKNAQEQNPGLDFKYLKMNNITRENKLDLSSYTCVNASKDEVEKFTLQNGDFLFNTRNSFELVGKTCVFRATSDEEIILYNNNVMRIRFIQSVNPDFVNFAFSTKILKKKISLIKSGTTNVSAIYYKDLKNLQIAVPPIDLQDQIVNELNSLSVKITTIENLYRQKLNNLEELKTAILDKAFAGQLTNARKILVA